MNKFELQGKIKSVGIAYLLWFVLGAHYAYLGKWGVQFLYWITLGGVGIWALIDLFTMSKKVSNINAPLLEQIELLEKNEPKAEVVMA